jgi:FkbM family methyltransferase
MPHHWRRVVRQRVAPFIPERLKAPLRPRLFGYRPSHVTLPVAFSSDDRGPLVTIDHRATIRYRDEDAADVRYHLVDNGESIEEIASFLALAASARTFFDVGAWKGLFSLAFCAMERDQEARRAVAYEPSSSGVTAMIALADLNDCTARLALRPVGVGLSAGRASARIAPGGIISVDADAASGNAIDAIPIVSIDEEVRTLNLVPDLLKIDVEGYEYEVLAGARRLLRERKPPICLELHLDLLERRGQSAAQVIGELEAHGYGFRSCIGEALSTSHILNTMHVVRRLVAM